MPAVEILFEQPGEVLKVDTGKVILQTQNFNEFAGRILKLMPSK